jgi:hypothetical protein
MTILQFIAAWFALSIPFCLFIGKFIAYGTGSDLEAIQPVESTRGYTLTNG